MNLNILSPLDKYWSEIVSKFDELTNVLEKAREEMRQKGGEALRSHLAEFFNDFPKVKALGWTQYTPYFNDGDECVFGVGDVNVKLSDDDIEDDDAWGLPSGFQSSYNLYDYAEDETQPKVQRNKYDATVLKTVPVWEYPTVKKFEGDNERLYNAINKLSKDFQNNEEIFKMAFGDHCSVVVNRDGSTEVEGIDHD